jgi:hypothetical protein
VDGRLPEAVCYRSVRVDRKEEREARRGNAQSVQVPGQDQGQDRTQAKHGLQNKSGEPRTRRSIS